MHLHISAGPPLPTEAEAFLDARLEADSKAAHEAISESADDGMRQFTERQAKYILLDLYKQARDDFAEVRAIFGDVNNNSPQWIEAHEREKALRTALYLILSVYRHEADYNGDWTNHLHLLP
ncbi:hypothetical protein [Nocardia arthritidis]|uniref:Uncharacterized protein n=1 Tax=Nocardia arthritidis TaxID=228602 RepID=A0A6G9Y962_9NOCA|nr:hypothetical protein [Nocardia arthritidis]QIS09805.1 hypothetical protein F5544_09525 [Nocardia arthritidis]